MIESANNVHEFKSSNKTLLTSAFKTFYFHHGAVSVSLLIIRATFSLTCY